VEKGYPRSLIAEKLRNALCTNIAKGVQLMKMKEGSKMLKKFMKCIRRQLLKIDWFKRKVDAYQVEQKKQRHHERWARLMHTGCTVRELRPEKLESYDTLGIVTDDGALEEWQNGKVVGREPLFIDSTAWGTK